MRDFFQAYARRSYKTEAARKRAITRDLRATNRVINAEHAPSYAAWKRAPWKYDLAGVDTKGSERSTRQAIYRVWMNHLRDRDHYNRHDEEHTRHGLNALRADLEKARAENAQQLKEITRLAAQSQTFRRDLHLSANNEIELLRKQCLLEKRKLEQDLAQVEQALDSARANTAEMAEKIGQFNQAALDFERERDACFQEKSQLQRQIDELVAKQRKQENGDVANDAEQERLEREKEDALEEARHQQRMVELRRFAESEQERISKLETRQQILQARRKELEEKYRRQ